MVESHVVITCMITSTGELLCNRNISCGDDKIQSDSSGNRIPNKEAVIHKPLHNKHSKCFIPYLVLSKTNVSMKQRKAYCSWPICSWIFSFCDQNIVFKRNKSFGKNLQNCSYLYCDLRCKIPRVI